ncbi:TPA: OmpA family protein [Enterobacter asburiae]
MLKRYFAPIVLASLVLAGCQSPPEGKFTPEQISAMKSYGFNELNGDWSLGMSDTILFDKNDARLRPESETQIQSMASRLAETGLNHARMDGHTDNYGEESYNEALSLKRANACRGRCLGEGRKYPAQQSHHAGVRSKIPGCEQQYPARAR